jgi:hypothetical protein
LSLDLAARPESGAELRRALRETLASRGADEYLLYSAQVGITEALQFLTVNTGTERITIRGQFEGDVLAITLKAQAAPLSANLSDDALAGPTLEAVAEDITMTLDRHAVAITMRFTIVP